MTNDMTKGAITPLLIRFTIPLVLGNLFQLTYNAADSIIVGKFVGEEALAAVPAGLADCKTQDLLHTVQGPDGPAALPEPNLIQRGAAPDR